MFISSANNMQDLSTGWLHCDPGYLFKPESYSLQGWVPHWVSTWDSAEFEVPTLTSLHSTLQDSFVLSLIDNYPLLNINKIFSDILVLLIAHFRIYEYMRFTSFLCSFLGKRYPSCQFSGMLYVLACLLQLLHLLEVSLQVVLRGLLRKRSVLLWCSRWAEYRLLGHFCWQFWYLLSFLQDFGDSIPGHGGITDRMDCQVHTSRFESKQILY